MGLFTDETLSGIVNAGTSIYNAIMSRKQNSINNKFAERNARLQEDVAYNGLGIRIADAERNGVSKWAVVGDGASAGQISNNTEPAHADRFDAIMDAIQLKQMKYATDKLKAEKDNLEYQKQYAEEHALPIGIQPGIEQSLLGWLDTAENRKLIEDFVGSIVGRGKDIVDRLENMDVNASVDKSLHGIKEQIPFTKEYTRKKYTSGTANGGENAVKKQYQADRSGSKARKRKMQAQNRNAGALPAGSIPPDLFMHKNFRR